METKALYTVRNHSIVLTAETLDLLLAYIAYFLRDMRSKLEEYQTEQAQPGNGFRPIRTADDLTRDAQQAIERANRVAHDIELLRDQREGIYTWHFEQLAEVFHKTRKHLEIDRIENFYAMKVVLQYLIEMLQAENPKFSPKRFVDYINADQEVAHGLSA